MNTSTLSLWRRLLQGAGLLSMSIVACSEATTAPPSGLPVSLTQRVFQVPPPVQPIITAFKDTAIMVTVQAPTCGGASAIAGVRGNRLVVTLTISSPTPQTCLLISGVIMHTVTVSSVPPGNYDIEFDLNRVTGSAAVTSTLMTRSVTLP